MRILCLGANHKTAPIEIREKLAFDNDGSRLALVQLKQNWPQAQFLLLSTCNRTELYCIRPVHSHPRKQELIDWLASNRNIAIEATDDIIYLHEDEDAVRHLLSVAAGLDSLVPGEDQIVTQLKGAWQLARDINQEKGVLDRLMQTALHTAKHIRSETDISLGKVSVSSVAVEFVRKVYETLDDKRVLVIGAGETIRMVLTHLRKLGDCEIVISNRSSQPAEELAKEFNAEATSLDLLDEHLSKADIVLCSTGSLEPLITAEMIHKAQDLRRMRPMLIVDVAVPRDVQPEAGAAKNVFLYNIDDLQQIVSATLQNRTSQYAHARETLKTHVQEFMDELDVRDVGATLHALYRQAKAIEAEELAEATNKLSTHSDAEEDLKILQRTLHRSMRRFLHPLVKNLRHQATQGQTDGYRKIVEELFNLNQEPRD